MDFTTSTSAKLTNIKINPLRGDDDRVQLRRKYRPDKIRFLIIGESPPHKGTFFYKKDSLLFKATLAAFEIVFPKVNQVDVLDQFQQMGFYLDDLCEEPVDQYYDKDPNRYTLRVLYEPKLKKRILLFEPGIIFYTPKTYLEEHIKRILNEINMNISLVPLPFPSRPAHKEA